MDKNVYVIFFNQFIRKKLCYLKIAQSKRPILDVYNTEKKTCLLLQMVS